MASAKRPVGHRPRWPDVLITVALLGLLAAGVAALFGPTIQGWFVDPPAPASPGPDSPRRPTL